jgi:hypothetical protein
MQAHKFEVGKPLSVAVPQDEGAVMELWDDGLVVLIQRPGCTFGERMAFKSGFRRYAYLESATPFPVAVWIFDFTRPHGLILCSFNATVVKPERIENYLDDSAGIKNGLTFYLLDGRILHGIKSTRLAPEAVRFFHATIRTQLEAPCSQSEHGRCLEDIMQYSAGELMTLGKLYRHGSLAQLLS